MGVCLDFSSVDPVAPEVERSIRSAANEFHENRPWLLCEPPRFDPDRGDGRLHGGSKLNLHPWADEWEESSQVQVERNDLEELLHRLCAWSKTFDVTWELALEGMKLGRIEDGVCPADVEDAIDALADVGIFLAVEFPME